jgi:hypothetical protein
LSFYRGTERDISGKHAESQAFVTQPNTLLALLVKKIKCEDWQHSEKLAFGRTGCCKPFFGGKAAKAALVPHAEPSMNPVEGFILLSDLK